MRRGGGIAFEVAVPRQRADAQPLAGPVADPGKLLQRIDVDQHRRLREPEIHCRNKTLTAGEKTRFVTVFGLQLQGLLDGLGGDVLERRWLHAAIYPRAAGNYGDHRDSESKPPQPPKTTLQLK